MLDTTLTYDEEALRQQASHYVLCYNGACSRHEHCLHYILTGYAPEADPVVTIVNPRRPDVLADKCTDFQSDAKRHMARGLTKFYDNIPEPKAKAIRSDLIATFNKTLYFKWRNGEKPITPEQQSQIASICRANGWNEPPVFDAYYEEYLF